MIDVVQPEKALRAAHVMLWRVEVRSRAGSTNVPGHTADISQPNRAHPGASASRIAVTQNSRPRIIDVHMG